VNIFCDLFGFEKSIAGPFDTEEEAVSYIVNSWDESYRQYLRILKSNEFENSK
jgi:hypothetical protein